MGSSEDFAPYLTLLQIFSYGTYASYTGTPNLPPLNDAQALKLRQLSLMTLAKDGSLSYAALMEALGLQTSRALEDLVVSSIYANLVKATLDPKSQLVQVDSVAALRDVAPGSIPGLLSSLSAWAARCDSTLADLERQIDEVRDAAARRAAARRDWDEKKARMIDEEHNRSSRPAGSGGADNNPDRGPQLASLALGGGGGGGSSGGSSSSGSQNQASGTGIAALLRNQHRFGKRGSGQMDTAASSGGQDDEAMDLDEEDEPQDGKKRSSRRKLQQG